MSGSPDYRSLREVKFMQGNEFRTYDLDLIGTYNVRMLVHSEEMLARHMYCAVTPEGARHIARRREGVTYALLCRACHTQIYGLINPIPINILVLYDEVANTAYGSEESD